MSLPLRLCKNNPKNLLKNKNEVKDDKIDYLINKIDLRVSQEAWREVRGCSCRSQAEASPPC